MEGLKTFLRVKAAENCCNWIMWCEFPLAFEIAKDSIGQPRRIQKRVNTVWAHCAKPFCR